MISADALAYPAIWSLFIVIPVGCGMMGLGRRWIAASLTLVIATAVANVIIALNVTEFGEVGMGFVGLAASAMIILLPISWHIGEFVRERRVLSRHRRAMVGE